MNPKELFEAVTGLKLSVTPELSFGIEIKIVLGTLLNYELQLGVHVDSEWTFSLNAESCPCPYLYGQTATGMKMVINSQPLVIFGYKLLMSFYLEVPLFFSV
jgi:hypothetical protein